MTAQLPFIITYNEEEYVLGGLSNGPIFSPEDWGVETEGDCSALWRGYNYGCDIIEDVLYLTFVYLNPKDELYPEIGGIAPEGGAYRGLKIKVQYNGKVRLLQDFDRQYYVHQGFQSAAAHDTVLDLTLEEGVVIKIVDRSKEAQRHRRLFHKGFGNSSLDIFGYQRIWRMLGMAPLRAEPEQNNGGDDTQINSAKSKETSMTHEQIVGWVLKMWSERFPKEAELVGQDECSKQAQILARIIRDEVNSLIKYESNEEEAWDKTQKNYLFAPAGPEYDVDNQDDGRLNVNAATDFDEDELFMEDDLPGFIKDEIE